MTKLLISVKNVEEAMLALAADVDMIDLKEPSVGALGALDLNISRQIVQLVSGRKLISATVGEEHRSMHALILDIQERAAIGVDIIKIAVSDFFYALGFIDEML